MARNLKCAHPACPYLVHRDDCMGGFCCKRCHASDDNRPEHGQKCDKKVAPTDLQRSAPRTPENPIKHKSWAHLKPTAKSVQLTPRQRSRTPPKAVRTPGPPPAPVPVKQEKVDSSPPRSNSSRAVSKLAPLGSSPSFHKSAPARSSAKASSASHKAASSASSSKDFSPCHNAASSASSSNAALPACRLPSPPVPPLLGTSTNSAASRPSSPKHSTQSTEVESPRFAVGVKVSLHSLQNRKDLNGKKGELLEWQSDLDKWVVRVEGEEDKIRAKEKNLTIYSDVGHNLDSCPFVIALAEADRFECLTDCELLEEVKKRSNVTPPQDASRAQLTEMLIQAKPAQQCVVKSESTPNSEAKSSGVASAGSAGDSASILTSNATGQEDSMTEDVIESELIRAEKAAERSAKPPDPETAERLAKIPDSGCAATAPGTARLIGPDGDYVVVNYDFPFGCTVEIQHMHKKPICNGMKGWVLATRNSTNDDIPRFDIGIQGELEGLYLTGVHPNNMRKLDVASIEELRSLKKPCGPISWHGRSLRD